MPAEDSINTYCDSLERRLSSLPSSHAVAFAACTAQRFLLLCQRSCREPDCAVLSVYCVAMDAIWRHVSGERLAGATVKDLYDVCLSRILDVEALGNLEALDACHIVSLALECCQQDAKLSDALEVAFVAYEYAVGRIDHDAAAPDLAERIWKHDTAQREVCLQKQILAILAELTVVDAEAVRELKRMVAEQVERV